MNVAEKRTGSFSSMFAKQFEITSSRAIKSYTASFSASIFISSRLSSATFKLDESINSLTLSDLFFFLFSAQALHEENSFKLFLLGRINRQVFCIFHNGNIFSLDRQ